MRIVSLIASATEIVHALGMGDRQVGRSHECDYPPSVLNLPVVTEPKFRLDGSSYEIDQRIKAILQEGLSVYRVLADRLDELRPDVIITQTQCAVCAVSLSDIEGAVCEMISSRHRIVALEPNSLADIFADIQQVARALAIPQAGEKLTDEMRRRMEAIAIRVGSLANHPTVALIEWIDPLMAAGNWMPSLVEMAGGRDLYGAPGKHSGVLLWENLVASDPDAIIVAPCGYTIEQSLAEMERLSRPPGWSDLSAVRSGRVFVADGNQFFNRPGPRVTETLEILAEILHPAIFTFGHEGSGWIRLSQGAGPSL